MDTNPLFTVALGLVAPWRVVRSDFRAEQRLLEMEVDFADGSSFPCPECHAVGCKVYDTQEKRWRHLDFFQHQAFIIARVPRVKCDTCGVRLVTVPWARPKSGFTLLAEALILELVRAMPVRAVERLLGTSGNRIWRVIRHYVTKAVARIDCSTVEQIGVDETSMKRKHDYISLFYDMEGRRLIFATEGREHQVIADFARSLGERRGDASGIREVSCDMSPAFCKGIRKSLPNAEITFDRFHVSQLLGNAIDNIRRKEMRADKTVKGARFALLKDPRNLTAKQRDQLQDITKRNAALSEIYRMKETFRDLYKQPDLAAATGFLKGWVTVALQSKLKPLVKVATTIERKAQGILRWYTSHLTNAVMEGLNSLLQAAKRKARGYKRHATFITMAYLIAGKLELRVESPFSRG